MSPRPDQAAYPSPRRTERRLHSRVAVALLGRYMLSDRHEYPCQSVDLSPGGGRVIAPVKGEIGERVVLYWEHLGRVEGRIARHLPDGFAFTICAAMRKRDKIASLLTWLANRRSLGLPEDRRHERIAPRQTASILKLENGREYEVRIRDVSLSGAALSTEQSPPIGAAVTLGSTPALVTRHLEDGIAAVSRGIRPPAGRDEGIAL